MPQLLIFGPPMISLWCWKGVDDFHLIDPSCNGSRSHCCLARHSGYILTRFGHSIVQSQPALVLSCAAQQVKVPHKEGGAESQFACILHPSFTPQDTIGAADARWAEASALHVVWYRPDFQGLTSTPGKQASKPP